MSTFQYPQPGVASANIISIVVVVAAVVLGLLFAVAQFCCVKSIKLAGENEKEDALVKHDTLESDVVPSVSKKIVEIYNLITVGAQSFLKAEYLICVAFIVIFGVIVFVCTSFQGIGSPWEWAFGGLSALSFAVGGLTSILSGYIGMMVAVFSNARTTTEAMRANEPDAWKYSFNAAFRAGGVMGFSLCALALVMVYLLIVIYSNIPLTSGSASYQQAGLDNNANNVFTAAKVLFEAIAGFGLGGSSIALFGRVVGGIYTKAADVGADLAGKVVENLPEDDPRNPAVIADNVGDNVGDVAGMGSDLFGSFGEATCAALVVGSTIPEIVGYGFSALLFPLYISAAGIPVCFLTSFFATDIFPVRNEKRVELVLKIQLLVSSALMTGAIFPLAYVFLPPNMHLECDFAGWLKNMNQTDFSNEASVNDITAAEALKSGALFNFSFIEEYDTNPANAALCSGGGAATYAQLFAALCVCTGLWGGCAIGFVTEYFTSASYKPVQEVAKSTLDGGAATNIIYGLALGYQSVIIPVSILTVIIYANFSMLNMYGVALGALGMLSTLATCLSIDVYGPVCDNAGGIAEMAGCEDKVRQKTDALDAAGNTTAAIGKGFAIGSAALVSLALFGAFVTRSGILEDHGVNLLRPICFAFLLFGSMLPYWFTAMTMKSVGTAAMAMVAEVARQFKANPALLEENTTEKPDYHKCIAISTNSSLKEMIAPGLLVIFSPIIVGIFFGVEAVAGLLAGGLVSGVQMAISQSNSGGAWDNAKKFVESGRLLDKEGNVLEKGTEEHKACVVGDTVGDPLKDTSGPALNILMKLMAIISLVFCQFFMGINNGCGLIGFISKSHCLNAVGN
jgi:inorganic pyrophosphatase